MAKRQARKSKTKKRAASEPVESIEQVEPVVDDVEQVKLPSEEDLQEDDAPAQDVPVVVESEVPVTHDVEGDPITNSAVEPFDPPVTAPVQYAFPRNPRCPGCLGYDSEAYATKGDVQYRRCRRVGCGINFPLRAIKAKKNDENGK